MITQRELGYVNIRLNESRDMPYPGQEYAEETMQKLIKAFQLYNEHYAGKEYDIVLSNGEQILFSILEKNLSHMLGVEAKSLMFNPEYEDFRKRVLGYDSSSEMKTYKFLTDFIKKYELILEYDKQNPERILNYYRIMIKCLIFEKLANFSSFNFGVINFDKEQYCLSSSHKFLGNSEKFIYVQSDEPSAPYFLTGIIKDGYNMPSSDGEERYVVETLIAPYNNSEFFNNQEVTIPIEVLTVSQTEMRRSSATIKEKLFLLNQYQSIIDRYKIPNRLNVTSDYASLLIDMAQQEHMKEQGKLIRTRK